MRNKFFDNNTKTLRLSPSLVFSPFPLTHKWNRDKGDICMWHKSEANGKAGSLKCHKNGTRNNGEGRRRDGKIDKSGTDSSRFPFFPLFVFVHLFKSTNNNYKQRAWTEELDYHRGKLSWKISSDELEDFSNPACLHDTMFLANFDNQMPLLDKIKTYVSR